jgi:hypothetical protein
MAWATSPPPDIDDRYVLRDLVWCGLCGITMEPALLSQDRRFYGCRNIHCPRPLVPADLLEALVWQAFLYLFPGPESKAGVQHALDRVTVGADLGEVRYGWRDLP